jgi:hypothetical protein
MGTTSLPLCANCGNKPVLVKKDMLCSGCYWRQYRHGSTDYVRLPNGSTTLERFEFYTVRDTEPDGCWLWCGATSSKKQRHLGIIWDGTRQTTAHRWAYEHFVGPIPDGAAIGHRCDTPQCVRPDHLEIGIRHRMPSVQTPEERFSRYAAEDRDGHWMWSGPTNGRDVCDYGRLFMGDKAIPRYMQAHRWAYQFFIGPVPDGLELDHLCEITLCVNPWHLDPVPHAINVKRGNRWPGPSGGRKAGSSTLEEREALRPDCPSCGTLYVTYANGKRRCPSCYNARTNEWARRTGRVTGEGTGARQRERTHCTQGHEYTPENTYISPKTGVRDCKICRKNRNRESRERLRVPVEPVTQCVNGHDYTPENTFIRSNGRRSCRACMKKRKKGVMERKRVEQLKSPDGRNLCPMDCTCGRHTRSGPRRLS